ncbi:MAG TPA: asparagine synthetase B [Patescibacteria group bacterium]|nr:asparagine synthetase B [Patescibacteria group bacterium]
MREVFDAMREAARVISGAIRAVPTVVRGISSALRGASGAIPAAPTAAKRRTCAIVAIIALAVACALPAAVPARAELLVPMDLSQSNHLKAYGFAYHVLEAGENVRWLLNYRSGSFLLPDRPDFALEAQARGVTIERVGGADVTSILGEIEQGNMEIVLLEKAPKIAIYAPPNKQPWDDAVMMALDYAGIPYKIIYDGEVLRGELSRYDWLHLHHEDFTGQYGKFYAGFRHAEWYIQQQILFEKIAASLGFDKVSEEKKAVARAIKEYVRAGGFLFAMCSATDSIDIALAAEGIDIAPREYDHDGTTPNCNDRLDYKKCFAFEKFRLIMDPYIYEFSDIDMTAAAAQRGETRDYFTLFEFAAKYDPVPTMLVQNHVSVIKGFMGQTTGYRRSLLKTKVIVMGEVEGKDEVRYIHGNFGMGTFTFLGGHDPEDYQHFVGDPPTDLGLYPNSPGYRLILNNILFPAAKKKERKT